MITKEIKFFHVTEALPPVKKRVIVYKAASSVHDLKKPSKIGIGHIEKYDENGNPIWKATDECIMPDYWANKPQMI
jgi:hypothetical protein